MTQANGAVFSPRYAWYVVGVLMLANVSGFVDRQILSLLVAPIQRDLGVSLTQIGYLYSSFAVSFTLMAIPIARIADSGNRRNVVVAGVAFWSIMTALSGFAHTFWRLFLARIGVGVGETPPSHDTRHSDRHGQHSLDHTGARGGPPVLLNEKRRKPRGDAEVHGRGHGETEAHTQKRPTVLA